MIISYTNNFIFIKPIKVAGSSVENALRKYCDFEKDICTPDSNSSNPIENFEGYNYKELKLFNHARIPKLLSVLDKKLIEDRFKVITIARNPWDQQVSSFWHTAKIKNLYEGVTLSEVQKRYKQDFKEFIHETFGSDINKKNQSEILNEFYFYSDGVQAYNNILRFEKLQSDFNSLCEELNLEKQTLSRFKGNYRLIEKPYREYYDEKSQSLISETFNKFIRWFNYEF